jgi:hypothetical protein
MNLNAESPGVESGTHFHEAPAGTRVIQFWEAGAFDLIEAKHGYIHSFIVTGRDLICAGSSSFLYAAFARSSAHFGLFCTDRRAVQLAHHCD